jgi:hypothetical protein
LKQSEKFNDYREASEYFDMFLKMSGKSRFLTESFQGYRNIALCEYNMALKDPNVNKRNELLDIAIKNYSFAITCAGGDPEKLSNSPTNNEFNARFNRCQAQIERGGQNNLESAKKELAEIVVSVVPFLKLNWHGKANILSLLCRASVLLGQFPDFINYLDEMLKQYEGIPDIKDIEKQPYGIQNARQNLEAAEEWNQRMAKPDFINEFQPRVLEQLKRVRTLPQQIPQIPLKDWSEMVLQIEAKFLKRS